MPRRAAAHVLGIAGLAVIAAMQWFGRRRVAAQSAIAKE